MLIFFFVSCLISLEITGYYWFWGIFVVFLMFRFRFLLEVSFLIFNFRGFGFRGRVSGLEGRDFCIRRG